MTTLIEFPLFYRNFGVKRVNQLLNVTSELVKALPKNSRVHHLGSFENPRIDPSDPFYAGRENRIILTNVPKYHEGEIFSKPSKKMVDLSKEGNSFVRRYSKRFKYVSDLKSISITPSDLVVYNYGYLDIMYRYPQAKDSAFNALLNKLYTVAEVVKQQKDDSVNNFVILDIPETLIGPKALDRFSELPSRSACMIFDTVEKVILREMWLWLTPSKEQEQAKVKSFLTSLNERFTDEKGVLSQPKIKNLNFVFRLFDGKVVIINLGFLSSWIYGNPNLTDMTTVKQEPFEMVRRYYLRSLVTMQSINANGIEMQAQMDAAAKKALQADKQAEGQDKEGASEEDETFLQEQEQLEKQAKADDRAGLESDRESNGTQAPSVLAETDPVLKAEIDLEQEMKELQEDLDTLDELDERTLANRQIQIKTGKDGSIEDVVVNTYDSEVAESLEDIESMIFNAKTVDRALEEKLAKKADEGRIASSDYRKMMKMVETLGQAPDPYGSDKTVAEVVNITSEDLKINKTLSQINTPKTVIDESMTQSSLNSFNAVYNTQILNRHIVQMIQSLQKSGVIVKSHTVDRKHSVQGTYDLHVIELKPIDGQPSIIRHKVPVPDEEGVFTVRGNRSIARAQICDLPIRRIGPARVGLSSYYGKSFVDRSTKKANSYLEYVIRRLNKATIEPDENIRDVAPGNVFDNYFEAAYIYNGLAASFQSFKAGEYSIFLNHKDRLKAATAEVLAKLEVNGRRLIGQGPGNLPLVVDTDNQFFLVSNTGERAVGDIFDIMKLDRQIAPVDFAEVKVFSKGIPVGMFIGYQIGLRRLIKFLKARHRIVEGKSRKDLNPYEYVVQFKDVAYIFDRRDQAASLVLSGFRDYEKEIKGFDAIEFDSQDVYLRLLQSKGLTSIYLTEMENLIDMFIDPITEQILLEMGEPRTFMGLLIRACEMLKDYHHPASQDMNYQRIRGYERIAGLMYRETANAIRSYRNRNRTGRSKVDISPYQFWATFTRDSSVKIAEDINPIQSLKGQEAVTYVGEGGRSKDSMNRDSRAYHKSNLGVLSEASVDSSDVGINAFMAADPGLSSVLGLSKKGRSTAPTNLFSTSALLAPFSNHDDAKRVAFVSIQQAHTIATEGYHAPVVRTGYESVIGHRTGQMFASSAKQDGKVISVTDSGIIVQYEDGTQKGFPLGQIYGKAEGSVYPHNLVTDMVVGQTFKKGDFISYNRNFFEKDPILPGGVVYKGSLLARVAMIESSHTHEDSSVISEELSKKLTTTTTKVKTFTVGFKQNIHNVVKVGQKVKPEDVLMIIEDEITSMDSSFGAESMAILANLAKMAPKASYNGEISKIEVFYHGEKTDMSASLKSIADRSDRKLAEMSKSTGMPVIDGSVDSDYSVEGTPLALEKAVIKIYINVREGVGTGDKIVVGNQLKTVVGEVMTYKLTTKSGLKVDAKFGAKSFAARIVSSLLEMGVLASTLEVITKKAVEAYKK